VEARIIGMKSSGKSTLMAALAKGRTDGTVTTIRVGDERIRRLSQVFTPRKTTFAEFRVREVAWPAASARKAQMERYLDQVAGAQVFIHVLRAFENPMLAESADAQRDLQMLDSEFVFADLMLVERALERSRKQPLSNVGKTAFARCREALEDERPLRHVEFGRQEADFLKTYQLLTLVPQIIVVNLESDTVTSDGVPATLPEITQGRQVTGLPFPEAAEVAELSPAEQLDFAEAMGLPGTAADLISHAAFSQMGLISFFTVGEDEVRSWPIREGTRARQAAGAIHSDIERGFIRAEVVGYDTFMEAGSLKACRENGTLRIEGKDYQVADGNIINYRFNV